MAGVLDRIDSICRREHAATVELIEALVECHRSREHVDAGYKSVFALLTEKHRYSRAAASRRFAAMRCALHGSFVIDMLRSHRTSLTALAKLVSVLDDVADPIALLKSIDGLAAEDVDAVVAVMRPIPRPMERVRPVTVKRSAPSCGDPRSASGVGTLWGSSAPKHVAGAAMELRSAGSAVERGSSTVRHETSIGTSTAEHQHPRHPLGTTCGKSAAERTDACNELEPRVAVSFTLRCDAYTALERVRTRLSRSRPRPLTLEETIDALVREHEARHARPRARRTVRAARPRTICRSITSVPSRSVVITTPRTSVCCAVRTIGGGRR